MKDVEEIIQLMVEFIMKFDPNMDFDPFNLDERDPYIFG